MRVKISTGSLHPFLRMTFLAGLILFILAGIVSTVLFFVDRSSTRITRQQENFSRLLLDYDDAFAQLAGTEREYAYLNSELDKIEKMALTVESWLSVLKRRRSLAMVHPPSQNSYANSIDRALKVYPASQPIAAIAASALIKNSAINTEAEQKLRDWLYTFQDGEFNNLALSIHILLGDFRNPARASSLPAYITRGEIESVNVDLAVLKTLREDYRGASADIQIMLNSNAALSDSTLRFTAEYFYDFGDLERSAEIFSMIDDEKALVRQADALYLAGFTDMARSIWSILASLSNANSLYNLALSTDDTEEAASHLEKLVSLKTASENICFQAGLIRYSRYLDYQSAVSILQNTDVIDPARFPFVDLEIYKRNSQLQESGRQAAEAWLLLDRHPENKDLYFWVSRLFFYQRLYQEARILLRRVEQLKFEDWWIPLYKALLLMNEGDIDAAQEYLRSIHAENADWPVYANLGRILEAERSLIRAIEQYETASISAQNPKTLSRIQLYIARCSSNLGHSGEARRALEYAVELDPENLTARLELERMAL